MASGALIEKEEATFSAKQIAKWRDEVAEQREILFHRNWKNRRPKLALQSKEQEDSFRFVIEWCEEFGDVVGRDKERARLDDLLDRGLDVNAPENAPTKPKRIQDFAK